MSTSGRKRDRSKVIHGTGTQPLTRRNAGNLIWGWHPDPGPSAQDRLGALSVVLSRPNALLIVLGLCSAASAWVPRRSDHGVSRGLPGSVLLSGFCASEGTGVQGSALRAG